MKKNMFVSESSCSKAVVKGKKVKNMLRVRYGYELEKFLGKISRINEECNFTLGQRIWIKVPGYCDWPGVMWNINLCPKYIIPELVEIDATNKIMIMFYGDLKNMWCNYTNIRDIEEDYERRLESLTDWGKNDRKKQELTKRAKDDLEISSNDNLEEIKRLLYRQNISLINTHTNSLICDICGEIGAEMHCKACERLVHALCLTPKALTASDLPDNGKWACPSCGEQNNNNEGNLMESEKTERIGLTPDWIVYAGAFKVFQLQEPNMEQPYIKGLLDPCTNSKIAPNIPAEIMYDKNDNGLKRANEWTGYYIILNPDYKAQIQWRFVNRAIDEVENDRVPAILLVCRNSTDTAYFHRLMPYPRVFLRRRSVQFKDYDKTPIGFGIVVFCIAKKNCRELYDRFLQNFLPWGEPNIVIDKTWLKSPAYERLLSRLHEHAAEFHRDHWIQCDKCDKWRIITYDAMLIAKDRPWTCKDLRPPSSSCDTPQTKEEAMGVRYENLSDADRALHGKRNCNLISHKNDVSNDFTTSTSNYKKKLRKYKDDLALDDKFGSKSLSFNKMIRSMNTSVSDQLSCNNTVNEIVESKTLYEMSDGIGSNQSVINNNFISISNDMNMDYTKLLTFEINRYNTKLNTKVKNKLDEIRQHKFINSLFEEKNDIKSDSDKLVPQNSQTTISGMEFKRKIKKEADAAFFDICCKNKNLTKEGLEKIRKELELEKAKEALVKAREQKVRAEREFIAAKARLAKYELDMEYELNELKLHEESCGMELLSCRAQLRDAQK